MSKLSHLQIQVDDLHGERVGAIAGIATGADGGSLHLEGGHDKTVDGQRVLQAGEEHLIPQHAQVSIH